MCSAPGLCGAVWVDGWVHIKKQASRYRQRVNWNVVYVHSQLDYGLASIVYCLRHFQSDDTYDSYCYELLFSDSWIVCLLQFVDAVFVIITIFFVAVGVFVVMCMIEWIFNILPLVKSYAIKKTKCYDHLSSRNCYRILFTRTMHNHQYNTKQKEKYKRSQLRQWEQEILQVHQTTPLKRNNTCRISIV